MEYHELSLRGVPSSRNTGYNWGFRISVFHEEIFNLDICGICLRFCTFFECNMCRGLDSSQPQTRRLIKVIQQCEFGGYISTFVLANQGSTSRLFLRPNKPLCKHFDADSDNVIGTVTRRLLGTKLVSGTTVGDVIIEIAKDVRLATEKPNKKVPGFLWGSKCKNLTLNVRTIT